MSASYTAQDMKTWFMSETDTDGAIVLDGRPYYTATYTGLANDGSFVAKFGSLAPFSRKVYLGATAIAAGTRTGFTAPVPKKVDGTTDLTLNTDYNVTVTTLATEFSYPTGTTSYINVTPV